MLFLNFAVTILVGYKYAAYYYWHSFRYVIPTDDGVTLQTFIFLKPLANSFTEGFAKTGLSSVKIYFKLKNLFFCAILLQTSGLQTLDCKLTNKVVKKLI